VHTAWKATEGFARGAIIALAQTPDGYLWLGTESGLVRFDGVRAVPWQPPEAQRLPSNIVTSLFTSRDGTLWIGTDQGLASWKGEQLNRYEVPVARYNVGRVFGSPGSSRAGRSARFRRVVSLATVKAGGLAPTRSDCTETAGAICGWERQSVCGDGNQALPRFTNCRSR
jgi:hypothetical protein